MSVNQRFKKIRKSLGYLNQGKFGMLLGTNQVGISDIETGKKKISVEIMENLFNKYNVNLNYLITGNGNMFIKTELNKVQEEQPIYDKNRQSNMELKAALEECRKDKERAWLHRRPLR